MYIKSECDSICKEYSKMVKERSKKTSQIWSYIFLAFLVVMIALPLIPDFLDKGDLWVLYIIYGSLVFIGLSIALLISIFSISDKPAFEYLYKEIYDKLNLEEGTFYNYESFEKDKFEFNKKGGLFSRHCRTEVKRHITGTSPNGNKFEIFDVTLVTGGGKNRHEHFKGIYFISQFSNSYLFQLRSHSKPRLKDVKYKRVNEIGEIKVFVEEERDMANLEHKYISMLDRLKRNLKAKKIYLSVLNDEIHFAYVPKVPIRKQYNLNMRKMSELYSTFLDEIRIIDELVETSKF